MGKSLTLGSEAETAALATRLAPVLRRGDTVLLSGPVGAGKTAFARATIRAMQAAAGQTPEEVPSPSYTLVQEYAVGDVPVWHADLYRLSDPDEVIELGLEQAFAEAVVLVEWPDLLGPATPERHLSLAFAPLAEGPDLRRLTVTAHGPGWEAALDALRAA
ncbi:tRNA (adenosine(37)-N6)-threonylcarbamoyltransferase complex ATPase subunit type 1 TsaE [Halovulum dunhuangense]|uniref:tRNA threonylcarbamoyladenosine biosynthesis protein TsaE n=1 Tax=Halovulum dunhuangense TaxID=1505036 RepID=A0A849KUD7_9RHOB|nr:tRNA (adenosine(37)-N6)-threonylcarbamoyltransferase complex ATPase subunit type 1 TsaE [Halovulum dunhuangense]NNU79211.1 tRNA (adenosine(37)-N6)-threonylcarbamoyltransferase complex ATPase subunit type 1 TsaE [Halovulum dunhuangense]